jgi:hypothetical protein
VRNLQRIRNFTYEELKGWKLRYKQNEYRQRQKLGLFPDHTFIEAEDEEFGLPVIEADEKNDRPKSTNIFIGDTGASCHMVHSANLLTDINEKITIGNGKYITATQIGKLRGYHVSKDGKKQKMILHDVKVVPKLAPFNLFSITRALNKGFILGNDGKTITVKKGSFNLKFDHEIKTKSGYVAGAMIVPRYTTNRNETEVATPTMARGHKMNIERFHQVFGHQSIATTKQTAKCYGIQ